MFIHAEGGKDNDFRGDFACPKCEKSMLAITSVKQAVRAFPYLRIKLKFMIHVRSFTFNPFMENTYVVYTDGGSAVIVDPGCSDPSEERQLDEFITEKKLTVKDVLLTHCHIDHVLGLNYTAGKYVCTPLMPEGELPVLAAAQRSAEMYGLNYNGTPETAYFKDDSYILDGEKFEILSVPGHSPAHVAFLHRGAGILLGGDVLFKQSIGRTDLPGGDYDTLIASIKNEIFPLDDAVIVYPGHMEPTTVGEEKRFNPFLR